jgi:hypothetical protein
LPISSTSTGSDQVLLLTRDDLAQL